MLRPRSETELLVRLRAGGSGKRVIAFPFAGGSAISMSLLSDLLPQGTALYGIEPPGHGRNRDVLLENLDEMAELYHEACSPYMGPGTLFFGHSMGALVAYKCIERHEKTSRSTVDGLIISGMNPPVPGLSPFPDTGGWTDETLAAFLCSLGGVPEAVRNTPGVLEHFLPAIKADLRACRDMSVPGGRLRVKAMVLSGMNDPCLDPRFTGLWQNFFRDQVVFHEKCGHGHFFYETERQTLGELFRRFMSGGADAVPGTAAASAWLATPESGSSFGRVMPS